MSQVTRSWLAFAALGAGLIHLALASGAGIPAAVALVVLGGVEFGWGVGVLSRDRFLVPRVAVVVAFVPAIGWSALLLMAVALEEPLLASVFPVFPMAIAVVFTLVIAAVLGRQARATCASSMTADEAPTPEKAVGVEPRQAERPYRYLIGLLAGALVVSALTTPALAATTAGIDNPHDHHGGLELPGEHVGH